MKTGYPRLRTDPDGRLLLLGNAASGGAGRLAYACGQCCPRPHLLMRSRLRRGELSMVFAPDVRRYGWWGAVPAGFDGGSYFCDPPERFLINAWLNAPDDPECLARADGATMRLFGIDLDLAAHLKTHGNRTIAEVEVSADAHVAVNGLDAGVWEEFLPDRPVRFKTHD